MWSLIHALIPDTLNNMMTSSNGNIFRVTGHLCGEFTGPRWIPHTKASDAEFWCFLWSTPKVNNREAGDVRRQHGHYDVIVMVSNKSQTLPLKGSCTLITRASYGVPRVWFWRAVTAKCGHAYQKQLLGAGTSNICSLYGGGGSLYSSSSPNEFSWYLIFSYANNMPHSVVSLVLKLASMMWISMWITINDVETPSNF